MHVNTLLVAFQAVLSTANPIPQEQQSQVTCGMEALLWHYVLLHDRTLQNSLELDHRYCPLAGNL